MKTITKEELCGYLPFELKFDVKSKLYPNPILTGINGIFGYFNYYGTNLSFELEKVKPIMHPLSSLTKQVLENGLIPIVELAKIAWNPSDRNDIDFKYQDLVGSTVFIAFSDKENVFGYDYNTSSFFGAKDKNSCSVVNQLQLFQKLYQWHFWLGDQSFFDDGIIIDKSTLK